MEVLPSIINNNYYYYYNYYNIFLKFLIKSSNLLAIKYHRYNEFKDANNAGKDHLYIITRILFL
jgi:hypothetical protein